VSTQWEAVPVNFAVCAVCGRKVPALFRSQNGVGPWRLARHKSEIRLGHQTLVDWCPGKYERQEEA
jgi:hypothetical protein